MNEDAYKNNVAVLECEKTKASLKIIFYFIVIVIRILVMLALTIGIVVHWFNNDYLTTIQILKWSIGTYWWAYLYAIIAVFLTMNAKKTVTRYEKLKRELKYIKRIYNEDKENLSE